MSERFASTRIIFRVIYVWRLGCACKCADDVLTLLQSITESERASTFGAMNASNQTLISNVFTDKKKNRFG